MAMGGSAGSTSTTLFPTGSGGLAARWGCHLILRQTEGFVALQGVYRIGAGSQSEESDDDPAPDDVVQHDTWSEESDDDPAPDDVVQHDTWDRSPRDSGSATESRSIGSAAELSTPPPSRHLARRTSVSKKSQCPPCWSLLTALVLAMAMGGSAGSTSTTLFPTGSGGLAARWGCHLILRQTEGFVALQGVYRIGAGSQSEESDDDPAPDDVVQHDTWVQSSRDNVHVYDFHIVYSFSYKVPVLYFQGLQSGASPPK
ncbi:hypothetical protein ZWY2020_055807 [Hordeum vulgare]|nr:hypothetical protein ZWY2020_055807 [Hordeum vulgare]